MYVWQQLDQTLILIQIMMQILECLNCTFTIVIQIMLVTQKVVDNFV